MKTVKRHHQFLPIDTHLIVVGIIILTAAFIAVFGYIGIEDITGVLFVPTLFAYPILRCLWDWIFVIAAVLYGTAKYIFERSCYYVSICKRHIRNGGVNRN